MFILQENFANDTITNKILKKQYSSNKWIAGICATPPLFFKPAGILNEEKEVVCYPSFKGEFKDRYAQGKTVVVNEKTKISKK